jgi:ubiquitin-conjugating enzyme E2 W
MNGNGTRCIKRLEKEIEDFKKFTDSFTLEVDPKNTCLWKINFAGAEATIYAGEKFTLQFKFNSEYVSTLITQPIDSPEVIFVNNIPEHEHIYSNGYICLSILYDGINNLTKNGPQL